MQAAREVRFYRFLFLSEKRGGAILFKAKNPTCRRFDPGSYTLYGELPSLRTEACRAETALEQLLSKEGSTDWIQVHEHFGEELQFLGSFVNPVFGGSGYIPSTDCYLFTGDGVDTIQKALAGGGDYEWQQPDSIVNSFYSHELFLDPQTLFLLKALKDAKAISEFVAHSLQKTQESNIVGLQTPTEFAPHLQLIPIRSKTVPPLITTTLVLIVSETQCLMVDPGAGAIDGGLEHFKTILEDRNLLPPSSTRKVSVFLTHHHVDHIEGLPLVASLYPHAVVYGHKATLDRVTTTLPKEYIEPGYEFNINGGQIVLSVEDGRGHTDGHMVLFQKESKVLIAGDHVVGFSSASLDAVCGDMRQYLDTCTSLMDLGPHMVIPAHGPPNYDPVTLLGDYIQHRLARETAILKAITEGGAGDIDGIIRIVYPDLTGPLVKHAKSNIILHLRKLKEDRRLPDTFAFSHPHVGSKV